MGQIGRYAVGETPYLLGESIGGVDLVDFPESRDSA